MEPDLSIGLGNLDNVKTSSCCAWIGLTTATRVEGLLSASDDALVSSLLEDELNRSSSDENVTCGMSAEAAVRNVSLAYKGKGNSFDLFRSNQIFRFKEKFKICTKSKIEFFL